MKPVSNVRGSPVLGNSILQLNSVFGPVELQATVNQGGKYISIAEVNLNFCYVDSMYMCCQRRINLHVNCLKLNRCSLHFKFTRIFWVQCQICPQKQMYLPRTL